MSSRWKTLSTDLLTGALGVALFAWAIRSYFLAGRSVALFRDNEYLVQPLFHELSRALHSGERPYWTQTLFGGMPLYDTPQFSITYPFYFLWAGIYDGPVQTQLWAHRVAVLHLFLLFVNGQVLGRVIGLRPVAALGVALVLALSGEAFEYSMALNFLASIAWLPLVLAGAWLVLEQRHATAGVLLGAPAWALMALATPSHDFLHSIYLVFVLWLARGVACARTPRETPFVRQTAQLALMGAIAAVLAGPMVLPALLHAPDMIRFLGDAATVRADAQLPLAACTVGQLAPRALWSAVVPMEIPSVLGRAYLGAPALALALLALVDARRRALVAPFFAFGLYMLLSSTGTHLGLLHVNHALPLLGKIREPSRHLIAFVMCTAVLAGVGLEALCAALERGVRELARARHLAPFVAGSLLVVAALSNRREWMPGAHPLTLVALPLALLAMGTLLAFAPARLRGWLTPAILAPLVLGLTATHLEAPRTVDGEQARPAVQEALATLGELARRPEIAGYRIRFLDGPVRDQEWANLGAYHGLRSLTGYMNPLPVDQFRDLTLSPALPHVFALFGEKYRFCRVCDPRALAGYRPDGEIGGFRRWVDDRALPRFTVVQAQAGVYHDRNELLRQAMAGWDFQRAVLLTPDAQTALAPWLGGDPGPFHIDVERDTLDHVTLAVELDRRGVLLVNEFERPEWHARVDGKDAPLERVNLHQFAVRLEPGRSRVELVYRPTLFVALLWLQRAACLALIAYALWSRRRSRPARQA